MGLCVKNTIDVRKAIYTENITIGGIISMEHGKTIANPGPLGLLGFGMTTILLNLHNAEIMPLSIVIVAMGLAMGGLAQIIAGIMEFKAGNTFGATAFTAYGCFWWSLVIIWVLPVSNAADPFSMGAYLLLWGIFTTGMFIGTLKHNTISKLVFASLAILFFLLAIGDFTGNHAITQFAGYEGIVCGAFAVYSCIGQIVNNEFGKEIFKL